ncbi:uncharacterized protein [Epargyreus clarus]|uniref:uncharacterized protein n=1 Tax=Epargyreus clarus TaxID=520877 RepID=UPI003C30702E
MDSDIPDVSPNTDCDQENTTGVRLIILNLPEDEGEGLGFRLTRTLWDPYPWVREVIPDSRADTAGLKTGDCLLQADGKDLLGLPIGQVAGLIRGDGSGHGVSLLCWNCGVDPNDDPELLWSCGGGSRGEKSRRALAGVVRALSCCVCAATATKALNCARSHLYCESCWSRLDRCALCRENLPPKDSPYARNLVAEQVFEAIATEYEIKDAAKRRSRAASAYNSPTRSPNVSPTSTRKGQYQLSMMNKRRVTQYSEKCVSDPNIQRSLHNDEATSSKTCETCKCTKSKHDVPTINVEDVEKEQNVDINQLLMQHKLVARLRQACSLADLQNAAIQSCQISQSMNNINLNDVCGGSNNHSNSMENVKSNSGGTCDPPVFVLTAPPIYLLTCDHNK